MTTALVVIALAVIAVAVLSMPVVAPRADRLAERLLAPPRPRVRGWEHRPERAHDHDHHDQRKAA